MPGYVWIYENRPGSMYYTTHSTRSNEYLLGDLCVQNLVEDLQWGTFGKIIMTFNYFCKKVNHKSLRGFWICATF